MLNFNMIPEVYKLEFRLVKLKNISTKGGDSVNVTGSVQVNT
jgi:hypothetical protein